MFILGRSAKWPRAGACQLGDGCGAWQPVFVADVDDSLHVLAVFALLLRTASAFPPPSLAPYSYSVLPHIDDARSVAMVRLTLDNLFCVMAGSSSAMAELLLKPKTLIPSPLHPREEC